MKTLFTLNFKLLTCILALTINHSALTVAQNPDIRRTYHWYFGNGAGLNFSNGQAVVDLQGQLSTDEGCSAISDSTGNLLFYSEGVTVWNYQHQVMQNGTNLAGCQSSTQSSLIIPQPGNSQIYYLFTTDCIENNLQNGLRYSIIDISQNGGLGNVLTKNILLMDSVTEKLSATFHSNKTDVWVVVHGWNTDKFYSFLITNAGIDTIPVISEIGSIYSSSDNLNATGYMKFSPSGNKIAVANRGYPPVLELFDFNNGTGVISNCISLSPEGGEYGLEFSPDETKLFVTIEQYPYAKLYQFDISSGIESTILSTKNIIDSDPNSFYNTLQLTPNGHILMTYTGLSGNGSYVSEIMNPNNYGSNVSFNKQAISLPNKVTMGLPNFISSYFNDISININEQVKDNTINDLFFYPNPANNVIRINTTQKQIQLIIYNAYGNLIKKQTLQNGTSSVDVSDLKAGIYFIKINTRKNNFTKKLIIIH